ncbi:hypothetical protein SAMN07250955_1236 [Arboricoccus pini]|uniref:Uncharacterized protein n=1 Tax=Arboricoccus pini TaxID=1963835 RepID=A0A212S428_9PROT|nr:hypothetical protein [Arboricoccus pini]SNB79797.1 hypothetical protein SAMN07250955_1236 [Arboricoccus pini]
MRVKAYGCNCALVLKTGAIIRRSIETVGKGRAVRLPWTDEAARDAVLGVRLKVLGKFV